MCGQRLCWSMLELAPSKLAIVSSLPDARVCIEKSVALCQRYNTFLGGVGAGEARRCSPEGTWKAQRGREREGGGRKISSGTRISLVSWPFVPPAGVMHFGGRWDLE